MGKTLGKVKTFFKPTKSKIVIGALTAATLAILALCINVGYKESITMFEEWWNGDLDVAITIDYNPLFYPVSHMFGHVKEEFETYRLANAYRPYVISQFIWNIPYYVAVGYVVGCSVVEGIMGVVRAKRKAS